MKFKTAVRKITVTSKKIKKTPKKTPLLKDVPLALGATYVCLLPPLLGVMVNVGLQRIRRKAT